MSKIYFLIPFLISWLTDWEKIILQTDQIKAVNDWFSIYIKNVAQMIQFLPIIAMLSWGLYILYKIFWLIKK